MSASTLARLPLVAVLLGCTACVQLRFDRDTRLEPLPQGALAALVPGTSDLTDALARLGPPLLAWEVPRGGMALAWGWYHSGGWQLRVSLPDTGHGESLYVDYASVAERVRGAVLFFDSGLGLVAVREGVLRELRDESRARPADVDEAGTEP